MRMRDLTDFFRLPLTAAMLIMLAGCASVDFDYPKAESTALTDTERTYIAGRLAESDDSGRYLPHGAAC